MTRLDVSKVLRHCELLGIDPGSAHLRAIHWNGKGARNLPPDQARSVTGLEQLQQNGYRLYLIPGGGQRREDVKAQPAVFVEWDDLPPEDAEGWLHELQVQGLPEPTLTLTTWAQGSLHAYWRLDQPCTDIPRWERLMRRLVIALGSDPACTDPSRCMRLAGSSYIAKQGHHQAGQVLGQARIRDENQDATTTLEKLEAWVEAEFQRRPELQELERAEAQASDHPPSDEERQQRRGRPLLPPRSLEQIADALQAIPRRGQPGPNGEKHGGPYAWPYHRLVLCGLRDALYRLFAQGLDTSSAHDPDAASRAQQEAIRLMEAHSPGRECGWNVAQVLASSKWLDEGTFWKRAIEAGWQAPRVEGAQSGGGEPSSRAGAASRGPKPAAEQRGAQARLGMLRAKAAELVGNSVDPSDRLPLLRAAAEDLDLRLRDPEMQRMLWKARRDAAGAVTAVRQGMKLSAEGASWAWEGLLMAVATNLLVSLPKVGKTILLLMAIKAWHQGEPSYLGLRFHGPCPPVIIAGTDMPEADWARMLRRAGLMGPDGALLAPIEALYHQGCPAYLDAAGIDQLAEDCSRHPGALLILDSYAKCTGPLALNEASAEFAGPLGDLQEAVAPFGATLAVIHHSGHSRHGEGAVAACRGNTALPAAASHIVALSWLSRDRSSTDKRVVLQAEGRGGEPLQLLIEQSEFGWSCHGDASEAFRAQRLVEAEEQLNDRQEEALELVRERWRRGDRTTSGDLVEGLNLPGPHGLRTARRVLNQLASKGLLAPPTKEATLHGVVVWFQPAEGAQHGQPGGPSGGRGGGDGGGGGVSPPPCRVSPPP